MTFDLFRGLAGQGLLLAALGVTAGVTTAGLAAGAAYGVVLCGLLAAGLRRSGARGIGAANLVTLSRAVLTGGVLALVVSAVTRPVSAVLLVALASVALALDGVDGQVARRTGTSSPLGARFDMEVDAFLILVLSVYAAGTFGWWTIAIGAARYVFVAASWVLPWLTAELPPRFSRKVVAAAQGVILVVAASGLLPSGWAAAALIGALLSLAWSFGRDVHWLYAARPAAASPVTVPAQRRRAATGHPAHV